MKRSAVPFVVMVLLVNVLVPSLAQAGGSHGASTYRELRLTRVTRAHVGPISRAAAQAIRSGPLPADGASLGASTAASSSFARLSARAPRAASPNPTLILGKSGLSDPGHTPSDSTGAIGPTRYIENVNSKVGVYDRNLNLLASDGLGSWWGYGTAPVNVFDPQVIWDATTNRFYYTGDAIVSASDNRLAFGFSKTASPSNTSTDWCNYEIKFGSDFPDFPKLGDSRYFTIIGANSYDSGGAFLGSDIVAIGKPPAGTTCPAGTTFKFNDKRGLAVGLVTQFTPVPASEVDTAPTGWVLTRPLSLPASSLGIFKVTRNSTTGDPVIQTAGRAITVPTYTVPASAPQKDGSYLIDTSDTRLTQAVAAVDPARGGKLHIWTQHAVMGGAGSMERWYEIEPVGATVAQKGTVSSASLYIYNGAISPDRVVNGTTRAFGSNMILGYNTSSSTTYPAIRMVGKRGSSAVSSPVLVKSSPGHNEDFGCPILGFCRWGDYAAATPDPAAPTKLAAGVVWLTSQWTADADVTGGTSGTSWRTWNWKARP